MISLAVVALLGAAPAAPAVSAAAAQDVAETHDRLAESYLARGDLVRFLDHARRALEAHPAPDDSVRALYRVRVGRAQTEASDVARAEESYREALWLATRARDDALVARVHYEIALSHWRHRRDKRGALTHFETSLSLAQKTGAADVEAMAWNGSGNLFRGDAADFPEARRRYQRGLAVARRAGLQHRVGFFLKNLGNMARRTGDFDRAEGLLREAIAIADRAEAGRTRWQARLELAQLYATTHAERADHAFRECLDVLEELYDGIPVEDMRAGALGASMRISDDPYDLAVAFHLHRGSPAAAFLVAERARARAFLDALTRGENDLPPGLARAEEDLLRRLSERQAALRLAVADGGRQAELLAAIQQDEDALVALRLDAAVGGSVTATGGRVSEARLDSLDALQRRLRDDEAVVAFFVGPTTSVRWVVQPDRIDARPLAPRDQIAAAVRRYLEVLRVPSSDPRAAGEAVSRLLVADLAASVPEGTRLIVVPHGVVHDLPFEALVDGRGRFLVEDYRVSYAPSASSWTYLRGRPPEAGSGLVAVGNPTLGVSGAGDERGLSLAHLGLLKPLPDTGREMRRVAGFFQASRVLEGERATEEELSRGGLQDAAVLHFATHGLVDEDRPERSGLALTASPPASDGLLQMREIRRVHLRASLVTLSACRTALGKEVTGEGIIGLTRAFFYGGARSVMASLWSVGDTPTAEFMTLFYGGLREGRAVDDAARVAKRHLLRTGRHPYEWAAFVVMGDAAVRPALKPATGVTTGGVAIVLAALASIAMLWRRRAPSTRPVSVPPR